MRPGQHNKRSRGRNRHRGSSGGGSGGGGGNPLSRVYDSNGPDVKVRGTAQTIAEKYLQLGRDAQSSGDNVMAESYYQHAEHYLRIVAAAQAYNQQLQQQYRKPGEDYDGEEGEDTGEAADGDEGDAVVERPAYGEQSEQPAMQAEQPFEGDRPQQQYRQRDRDQGRDRKPRWENRRDYNDQPRESYGEQRQQSQPRGEDQPPAQAEAAPAGADSSGGNWEAPSFLRKPSGNGSGRQRYERKPRKEAAPEGEAASEPAPEPAVVDAPQGE